MHKPKGFTAIDARFSAIEGNIVDILRRVSNLQRNWEKEIHGEREREREREREERMGRRKFRGLERLWKRIPIFSE